LLNSFKNGVEKKMVIPIMTIEKDVFDGISCFLTSNRADKLFDTEY